MIKITIPKSSPEQGLMKFHVWIVIKNMPQKTNLQPHKRLKKGNINNVLVKHNLETNHNFNFKDFKMLIYIHNKNMRENCLSPYLVRFVLKSYKILYSK